MVFVREVHDRGLDFSPEENRDAPDLAYCESWGTLSNTYLDKALVEHGVGYFQEATDVGAVHQIARRAVFLGRFVAVLVDGDHDVVQTLVHFLASPAQP